MTFFKKTKKTPKKPSILVPVFRDLVSITKARDSKVLISQENRFQKNILNDEMQAVYRKHKIKKQFLKIF